MATTPVAACGGSGATSSRAHGPVTKRRLRSVPVPVRQAPASHHTTTAQRLRSSAQPVKQATGAAAAAIAAAAAAALVLQAAPAGAVAEHSWQPCRNGTQCVSSNSFMQPAQYLPPWSYQPDAQQAALRSLLDELSARSAQAVEVDAAAGFVAARVPVAPGSKEYDSVQLILRPDGVVLFKSEASVNKPYPPFCLVPGCISGPANRQRLEALRDDLGWTVLEPDDDKQWVQILLH